MHTTTREANDRGYECLVVSDCVGSYFPEFQRIGLEMIKAQGGIFGWVADTAAVIPALHALDHHRRLRGPRHDAPTSPNRPPIPPIDPPAPTSDCSIPWWTRGDTNAFFGLGFNILVNVLTLTGLMIGVVAVPAGDVLGTVLPALGVALILGNLYYTFLARRLARRENRTDVTALPYGPSVPHMFIVVFVVMLPVYLNTEDPMQAWQAGLAWAFMIGVIVMIGAFVGPYIRKLTPRAAMLGTLAGISITFISMRPAAQMWEAAWIGLPVMAIILIGFFTNVKLPFGIPVGLAALLVGTAIGWIGGYMSAPDVGQAVSDIAIGIPDLRIDLLFSRAVGPRAAAGHRDPVGRLQLHRGDEQRGERRRRRRQLQPAQRAARRRRRRGRRFGVRLAVPARGLHRPSRLEGRGRPGRLLAGQRRRHRNASASSGFSVCSTRCCRCRRSCRSCSTSAC